MSKGVSLITRLGPGSVQWDSLPSGGKIQITKSDIAAALSAAYGMSREAQLLGLVIAGFSDNEKLLIELVERSMHLYASRKNIGEGVNSGHFEKMARSAYHEFITHTQCKHCLGSGKSFEKEKPSVDAWKAIDNDPVSVRRYTTCPECNGNGLESWSEYRRAKEVGIQTRTYGRRFSEIRQAGLHSLNAWLYELSEHISAQLNR